MDIKTTEKIKESPFYEMIRSMPKGALLHVHFSACINIYNFINYIKKRDILIYNKICYISDQQKAIKYWIDRENRSKHNKLFNLPSDIEKFDNIMYTLALFDEKFKPNGWSYLKDLETDEAIKAVVYSCTRMAYDIKEEEGEEKSRWFYLERHTNLYWSFIKDINIFPHYFKFILDEAIADGLSVIEIKSNLGSVYKKEYDKNMDMYVGTWLSEEEELTIMKDIAEKEKKIYFRLIVGINRGVDKDCEHLKSDIKIIEKKLINKCSKVDQFDDDLKKYISGIDIFGEEDIGIKNIIYIDELYSYCNKLNYYVHSGENNKKQKDDINNNLLALLLLSNATDKQVRVGHGLQLINSKFLVEMYKKNNIHVELCPLSNLIMGYVKKIEEHPGKKLFDEGVSVSINSDDPSIFGYDYVTFDWIYAIVFWNLSIEQIVILCKNSITSCSLDDATKEQILEDWKKKFDKWKEENKDFENNKKNMLQVIRPIAGGGRKTRVKINYMINFGKIVNIIK